MDVLNCAISLRQEEERTTGFGESILMMMLGFQLHDNICVSDAEVKTAKNKVFNS